MSLTKLTYEYEINGEEYILVFDMKSIALFKEMTGENFLEATAKIGQLDAGIILAFLASSLRKKSQPDEPLGDEIQKFNIIELIYTFHNDVIEIVLDSMPKGDVKRKKKIK